MVIQIKHTLNAPCSYAHFHFLMWRYKILMNHYTHKSTVVDCRRGWPRSQAPVLSLTVQRAKVQLVTERRALALQHEASLPWSR